MVEYRITERQLIRLNELIGELATKRPVVTSHALAEADSLSNVIRSTRVMGWTSKIDGTWEAV